MKNSIIKILQHHKILTDQIKPTKKYQSLLNKNPELIQMIINHTLFLQYSAPIKARLQCLIQGIDSQPICNNCGTPLKMRLDGRYRNTFAEYCGSKCFSNDDKVKSKRAKTNLKKYGHTNALQSDNIKEQSKQKLLEKYGVDNPLKNEEIRKQIKQTNLERYGHENAIHNENIKQKVIDTNIERYGVDNPLKNEEIRKQIKQTNLERYGHENIFGSDFGKEKRRQGMLKEYNVEYPIQNDEIRQKMGNTMIEKHGVEHALQDCKVKQKMLNTMKERHGVEHALQDSDVMDLVKEKSGETSLKRYGVINYHQIKIHPDSLTKINDKEWMEHQHITLKKTFTKIAEELDVAHSTIGLYMKRHGIATQTLQQSQGERDLVEYINSISKVNILTNDKSVIPPKELDVYVPDKQLAIEFNGAFWHSETQGRDKHYHLNKLKQCGEQGIRLIQILDSEWNTKREIVKSRLSSLFNNNRTIYARKTQIRPVYYNEFSEFFTQTHIQGNAMASVVYGLYYEDELVACMSFGKSRFDKKVQWELIRYSNALYTNVVGGASKLFKHFIKTDTPDSIITYSDKRWNTGNLYNQLGFTYTHSANPNYYYFVPSNVNELFHRVKFQKHKLKDKLEVFNSNLTEWENMQNNGYDRIWDCGNDVYVWKNEDALITLPDEV